MAYRKLKGDHLFDGQRLWEDNRVLVTDNKGEKIDIIATEDAGDDVLYQPGLISPGFVNAHCHLELSHMKNEVAPHTGLVPFLLNVVNKREFPEDKIHSAIMEAMREMEEDGIIAVGDICNSDLTAAFKTSGPIQWRNFIEVLSFTDAKASERVAHYLSILRNFEKAGAGPSSLCPHAPYSISRASFKMINEATSGQTISIHNQETAAENELYRTGQGRFLELFANFGFNGSPFPVTGTSSIRHYLPFFNKQQKILLVHNTFMPEEDIEWANEYAKEKGLKLVYCFCANANLFIENRLPPIDKFMQKGCQIVLGTDSYGSNWQLKISEEIITLHKNFPGIPVETILQWATLNGTDALGLESRWISGSDLIQRMENGK
jgi:cytosine/adenosine deaminase-related metal-dependent hydrolase